MTPQFSDWDRHQKKGKIKKTVEVPEFIWGQLSSRCLLDIQMEMLTKKLYVRLEFRGEVLAENKNDQFIDGN